MSGSWRLHHLALLAFEEIYWRWCYAYRRQANGMSARPVGVAWTLKRIPMQGDQARRGRKST